MNLTFSQAVERAKDLSGAIKAARAHEADCAADHAAKLRIADIAAEAHEKATCICLELEAEREALADHIAALVRKTGDDLADSPQAFNSVFSEPADFQAQALANGAERVTQAFEEATR